MKIRRRDLFATFIIWAVSALWCAVVWLYSVGSSRRVLILRDRLDDIESRLVDLESRPDPDPCRCSSGLASSPDGDQVVEPSFSPRLVGRGRTKSPKRPWGYLDIEVAPGQVERRYFPLAPLRHDDDETAPDASP